jgi:signal transduction histidine kinase
MAAELHDDLLQDTQGLVLIFQGLSGQLGQQHPLRAKMEATLDQADRLLDVARERASEQLSSGTEIDLGSVIRRLSEELISGTGIGVSLTISGIQRALKPGTAAAIREFARQALLYALTHAQAKRVEFEIEYGNRNFRIQMRDDGGGLNVGAPGESRTALLAIRDRVERTGARVSVWSADSAGTEVDLVLDARSAYL